MLVKDILPDRPVAEIMVRTFDPFGEDILFGFCSWDCRSLISLDGDYYSINEVVVKYEWDGDVLVYWIESEWESLKD